MEIQPEHVVVLRCCLQSIYHHRALLSAQVLSTSSCLSVCECPMELPRCAPGVSLVVDSCGCCKVCARQLNEDCSLTEPCDHTKGLECNFGASFGAMRGICRGRCLFPILLCCKQILGLNNASLVVCNLE